MIDFADLYQKIDELEKLSHENQQNLHDGFGKLALDYTAFEIDTSAPNSDAYRRTQFLIYEAISRKAYAIENEAVPFDVAAAVYMPSPYNTRNRFQIANHHSTLGFAFEHIELAPGSRIFEMGVGWGNLSMALAKAGYVVGGCDLEKRFVELVKLRAEHERVNVDIRQEEFLSSRCFEESWDAIIFNACFHHCDDHAKLLDRLAYDTPLGTEVYFLGESVYRDYPWPWGINLNGQAVYCINKFGWLELAFNEKYFIEELYRRGFSVKRHVSSFSKMTTLFSCKKIASYAGGEIPFSELHFSEAQEITFPSRGLNVSEKGHWTGARSEFTIPDPRLKSFKLMIANYKPVTGSSIVAFNGKCSELHLKPGEVSEVDIAAYDGSPVTIWSVVHNPMKNGWNEDDRDLGIYCKGIKVTAYKT